MGPGNDTGASTDCVRQPGPEEVSTASQLAGSKGSPLKCEPATTLRVYCFAVSRLER